MEVKTVEAKARGIRISVHKEDREVGRVYLYVLYNDLHQEPFGLIEDIYVQDAYRGQGIGSQLVQLVIERARQENCYKLVATSRTNRPNVHALYERLGLGAYGIEFRRNFDLTAAPSEPDRQV
ncbi:GNAT family N-acetyltransferase [Romeria aff. gracilis LEGE 07310]|uniref:GNAT family N-acetyltransferase n=1 Tax=Vasconcelosia minhoensis LEGE 07310 TaxID=915328 RepID=A0A8J7AAM8_9CYAN|nr:GNAT family N-acetyltransferase [Romeria gracilis]MBE9079270.1 GNAT family N-acetyltransferase [Romeria aff. gracilis LEGE 07310]